MSSPFAPFTTLGVEAAEAKPAKRGPYKKNAA